MFSISNIVNIYTVAAWAAGAFVFLWYYSQSAYNYWRKRNVKYLEPVPFVGNTFKFMFNLVPLHEEFDKLYKALYDEPFGGIYQFRQPQLIIKDPELISAILVKDFKHFYDRGFKQFVNTDKELDPLSVHLFLTNGERWRVLRQNMSPVFTSGKLKHMQEQIWDCIELMTKHIEKQMDENNSVDLPAKELFAKLSIDVIGSCAFGLDCSNNEKFSLMGKEAFETRLIVALRMLLSTFSQRLVDLLKIRILKKDVNDFYLNLTLDTMEYRRKNGVTRNDLLQLLMEMQNSHVDPKFKVDNKDQKVLKTEEFDELDIAANAFLFFVAGFETTAATLSYCFYELALNQDIQEKLRSEVQKVQDRNQTLTYESLRALTYMDAVISETLRKYPPVQILSRECTEDYLIPGTKLELPAGTEVIIPVWSIHHDWRHYPNPEVFDPERFVGDTKHTQANGTYIPFGDGPRFCLGKRFAEMEIKAAISRVVLNYNINPCAKTEIPLKYKNGSGLLQTTCGTWVNFKKR